MAKTLTVKLVKSPVCGVKKDQTATVRALGLHRINSTHTLPDNESVRGMIFKVKHLVTVEEN